MKKLYILILLWIGISSAYGQNTNIPTRSFQMTPETPTTSQFLRYDDMPVSEYTGVPNIGIPIYNFETDGLSIPINLTYHAGGIKVNQNASWVGLGWDLSLYSVVQIVNDIDDFSTTNEKALPDWTPSSSGSIYSYPYYPQPKDYDLSSPCGRYIFPGAGGYSKPVSQPVDEKHYHWLAGDGIFSINGVWNRHEKLFWSEVMGGYDSEPDIFKIKLPETTLNVVMNFKTKGFVILNKKGYAIKKAGDVWEIVNPEGIKFIFSDKTEARTETLSNGVVSYQTPSTRTWMISKIVTPKNREITFNYSTMTETFKDTIITQQQDEYIKYSQFTIGPNDSFTGIINDHNPMVITTTSYSQEKQIYLQSITFPLGKVEFKMSRREDLKAVMKLDRIEIKDFNNLLLKTINFNYNYLFDSNLRSKRLSLLSLIENGNKKYNFSYNNTSLPSKNSFTQDYWGYSNGYSLNKSLIPNPARFSSAYNNKDNKNNHSASLTYTKSAILEKITYPTGGTVSFEYELNTFNNLWVPDIDSLNNKISKGYGLRVKSISYKDGSQNLKKEEYRYEGGKTILPMSLIEKFSRKEAAITPASDYVDVEILSLNTNGFYSSNPLGSFNGVGYSSVIKSNVDNNGNSNGKIETFYHNNPDIIPRQPSNGINIVSFVSIPAFKDSKFPENGSMYKQIIYDTDDLIKKEITLEYTNVKSSLYYGAKTSSYARWLTAGFFGRCPADVFVVGLYPLFDFETLLSKKTEKEFNEDNLIAIEESYQYDKYNLLKSITTSNSSPYNNYKYFYYPHDYTDDIYKEMVKRNMLSPQIKVRDLIYNGSSKNETVINYANKSTTTGNLILPDSQETYFKLGERKSVDVIYNKYDKYGNILEYTTYDGITTVIIWSYKYSYPIAIIENTTHAKVAQALGGESFLDFLASYYTPIPYLDRIAALRDNTLFKDAMITIYTYKPLVGVLTIDEPSGNKITYEYDDFGQLINIQDRNGKKIQEHNYNYRNK